MAERCTTGNFRAMYNYKVMVFCLLQGDLGTTGCGQDVEYPVCVAGIPNVLSMKLRPGYPSMLP